MNEPNDATPPPPAATPAPASPGSGAAAAPAETPKPAAAASPAAVETPKPPAAAAPAPAAPRKAAPVPPAPQVPRNPGGAARLAKAATIVADKEQPPLAGNADLGWWVLNGAMTVGLIVLAAITIYSCIHIARAIIEIF